MTAHRPRIALLGCGTVGREVARVILARDDLDLVAVLVRDVTKDRGVPRERLVTRLDDALRAAPDLVIELVGGLEPAAEFIRRSLDAGIPVVTANKTVIAHHGPELAALARERGVTLRHEAAVAAGVPVLAALRALAGDRVVSIRGVVSGACNDILTRMASTGCALAEAVEHAARRGLVEPDPSADLSGRDSAEKLCVLADAAGFPRLRPEQVETRGIERIGPDDIDAARRQRCAIKLVAELATDEHGRTIARVGPALVPLAAPLAQVTGEHNAIAIHAELAGEIVLRGPGAGPRPTTSAVVSDVVRALRDAGRLGTRPPAAPLASHPTARRAHYIRVDAAGRRLHPRQVLGALREHELDHDSVDVSASSVRVLTGRACPRAVERCAVALAAHAEGAVVMPRLDE